jgi:hypothetical protein
MGMTGPSGSSGGFPLLVHFAAKLRGEDSGPLPPFELTTRPRPSERCGCGSKEERLVEIKRIGWRTYTGWW